MTNFYKKWFWPFVLPALIVFAFVVAIPFIVGFIYSFTNWRGTYFSDPNAFGAVSMWKAFIGFDNYVNAFKNELFLDALRKTVLYTVMATISINIFALLFALLIESLKKGKGFFRGTFFLPNLLGGLALGFIWSIIFEVVYSKLIFDPSHLNIPFFTYMLQDKTNWIYATVILSTWQTAGYMMIIYINGLNNIPKSLMEAADIDGATWWQKFSRVQVPMLAPSFTICIFLSLANSFKLLDQNIALTNGAKWKRLLSGQILRGLADSNPPDYGLVQAEAVIFFVLVAIITLVQVKVTSGKGDE